MIQLYCGDGKGKTTAAAGLSVRAAGAGLRVFFLQFLKDGTSSEISMLEKLGIRIACADCSTFTFRMNEKERAQTAGRHNALLREALAAMRDGTADVIVLDEIAGAVGTGMADPALLQMLLDGCPPQTELVLTGRDPTREMLDAADYISQIHAVRHPYENGIPARKGIEY